MSVGHKDEHRQTGTNTDGLDELHAVRCTGVVKRFGATTAVGGLSLEVPAGAF